MEASPATGVIRFEDIQSAAKIIEPYIHRTPVITCEALNERAGASLYFKCENLQKVGAFKFRGACNSVFRLTDQQAQRGVVTHSSGNHAQALALAAKMRGIPAHIVMPENAPVVKKEAVQGYGANVIQCAATLEARETTAERVQAETGATFIHPYNHPHVMAGQGTAASELLADISPLDYVIAPVGGGGLISGTCATVAALSPHTKVIAAEPGGADDAYRSKSAQRLIPQSDPSTIADGLLTSLGDLTWPFVRDCVEEVATVSDDEIVSAMKVFWSRTKLIIEPSAATAVAVALKKTWDKSSSVDNHPERPQIGIILSGGNVDLDRLPWSAQS